MIKVITADDHHLIRKGVKHILSKTDDIMVAGEAEDGIQLLALLRKEKYDVLLLDIDMPGIDIFDLLREIRQIDRRLPVIILSMFPEEQFGPQMFKAGVKGYINKSSGLNDLVHAVRQVRDGNKYLSPLLAQKLADNLSRDEVDFPHELLSEREFQVLCMIARGKTNNEIAEALFLSDKTISTYRRRILEKMGMDNNAQLTYYAIHQRLV